MGDGSNQNFQPLNRYNSAAACSLSIKFDTWVRRRPGKSRKDW